MNIEDIQILCNRITDEAGKVFVAADKEVLVKILSGFLAGGHILFEDNPGLGKTLLVKVFAKITGCQWKRIQFTPDLMPADIIGTKVWKGVNSNFEIEKGPIFTNFLLADEINRAMPKTQSALLEAMEEHQVTIEGNTYKLGSLFTVMATQNPIEMEGTYPLPEAQMDRFIMKISMGYLDSIEKESEILRRRVLWKRDDPTEDIKSAVTQDQLVALLNEAENVYVDENIIRYITEIIRCTRKNSNVRLGASPRGGLALLKLSRAFALINGRNFVIPDDVKLLAANALSHRIMLNVDSILEGVTPESVINMILKGVEVPKEYTRGI
ncbi:MAG: MoxR family ATPase [Bacillota bacterium]|nr:MoxR family ATPase [Bacillota bacterium]